MTLLEIVQNILSEMNSDPVNSIGDTQESDQVAYIVKDSYFDIIDGSNEWPFTKQYLRLEGMGDLNAPTKLKMPTGVVQTVAFKYNMRSATQTSDQWQQVIFMQPVDFMDMIKGRANDQNNIVSIDIGTGVEIFCYNDRPPQYYTSFDQNYIWCDSYDSSVDSTLQDSKTEIYAVMQQPWLMEDGFEPVMPYPMTRVLLNEAKMRAFASLKGEDNVHARKYAENQIERSKFTSIKTFPPVDYVRWGRAP